MLGLGHMMGALSSDSKRFSSIACGIDETYAWSSLVLGTYFYELYAQLDRLRRTILT